MPSLRYALKYSCAAAAAAESWLAKTISTLCPISRGFSVCRSIDYIGKVIIIRFLLFSRIRVQFGSCSADQQFSSAAAAAVELFLC